MSFCFNCYVSQKSCSSYTRWPVPRSEPHPDAGLWGRRGRDLLLWTSLPTLRSPSSAARALTRTSESQLFLKGTGHSHLTNVKLVSFAKGARSGILSLFTEGFLRQDIGTLKQETEVSMWLTKALGSQSHTRQRRPQVRACKPSISVSEERGSQREIVRFR